MATSFKNLINLDWMKKYSQKVKSMIDAKADKSKVVAMTETTATLDPNKVYVWGEVATLTVSINTSTGDDTEEFHFIFQSGATATTLTLPTDVVAPDGFSVEANKVYEISIVKNRALCASWEVNS